MILQDKTFTKAEALAKQKHVLAHGYIKEEVKPERGGDAFSSVKRERAGRASSPAAGGRGRKRSRDRPRSTSRPKEDVHAQRQEKQSGKKIDR